MSYEAGYEAGMLRAAEIAKEMIGARPREIAEAIESEAAKIEGEKNPG